MLVLSLSESQISLHIAAKTASCYHSRGHFETSAPNDPQITLNTTRLKVPLHTYHKCLQNPHFSPFLPTASHFIVRNHFEISALNDTKLTLNTTRSNIARMCVTGILEPKILRSLFLWQDRDTCYFEASLLTDPKMTLNATRTNVSRVIVLPSPRFQSFSVYDKPC